MFAKLQKLSQQFDQLHEKYIFLKDIKDTKEEEDAQMHADIKYWEEVTEKSLRA